MYTAKKKQQQKNKNKNPTNAKGWTKGVDGMWIRPEVSI